MREIKFRAWDPSGKRMYEYATIARGKVDFCWNGDAKNLKSFPGYTSEGVDYTAMVPLQFTGLTDKNGKEIYEGDVVNGIVKFPQLLTWQTDENSNYKMAGEIFYDHHSFSLKCVQPMCDERREGMVNYFDFIGCEGETFDDMEVIGNTYENPELLK